MTSSIPRRPVVTGFGPFGGHDYNPSRDTARQLAAELGVKAHILSVTYTTAAQFARAHLQAIGGEPPPLFIHFGLAADRSKICFEQSARNHRDERPDIEEQKRTGRLPEPRKLIDEARVHRTTSLDPRGLFDTYQARRPDSLPPAKVSEHCGCYVCNALYYHTLRACEAARKSGIRADAIFVHIPELSKDEARRLGRVLATILVDRSSKKSRNGAV